MRSFKEYLILLLKGMGMGASDVVPGVSGGTIAFITGIYEELINSIKSIDTKAIKLLFSFKLKDFWKKINGNFLAFVFGGILISVFTLANILEYLLENHAVYIWSFFFGLVIASAILILKDIKKWDYNVWLFMFLGVAISFWITMISPAETTTATWFIFLSGALAICAMVLPGISGSFILVLLGKYQFILAAVSSLNFLVLGVFLLGAIVGIIAFSNFLSWLLKKYRYSAIALLAGFMIGSLNKIWPWKKTLDTFIDRHGEVQPLVQRNIFPEDIGAHSDFLPALFFAFLGLMIIFMISRLSNKNKA